MLRYAWTCRCCGQPQEGLPLAWGPLAPAPYEALPEGERETRARINADLCIIDDREFYIRGLIELPIVGRAEVFSWIAWCSISAASWQRMGDLWEAPDRDSEPPFFGWLASALPYEPGTLGLKTNVHFRPPGVVPSIEIEPTDHPLAVAQRDGMAIADIIAIAERNHRG
jgi:hypothetical protein